MVRLGVTALRRRVPSGRPCGGWDPSDAVNHSTAVTRLQAGAGKEGVQVIDLDMRPANGTASDARSVYDRFAGSPKGKSFLEGGGQVRIATSDGVLTYTGQ